VTVHEDDKEAGSPDEALCHLPATFLLAKEMAKGLGRSAVLFGKMPPRCKVGTSYVSQATSLDGQLEETVSWTGTREAALERLQVFLPRAGRAYASSRNHDLGPHNRSNVSCLSPWIRHRLLLEEEVVRETRLRHSFSEAEKFLQEVFWRSYFKGWLEQHPGVWLQYRSDVSRLVNQLENSSQLHTRYENAISGNTGIDCFDFWAVELAETGYLHNHARMWFASIWIFTLCLPWQLGADFFYRHLLDGDPASNTLSWRWVAGLHTKGKNYIARPANIEKYTDGRFSPKGLVPDAAPLVELEDHPLCLIDRADCLPDEVPFGLVITEEDCHVQSLPLARNPRGICSLATTETRSPLAIGQPMRRFATDALSDASGRAQAIFECQVHRADAKDWGAFLVEWAQDIGVKTIVTSWIPVGPVRDRIDQARPALHQAGVTLLQIRRPYDQACWPHTTRGFFKLKAKIPGLIEQLNLS